MHYLLAVMTILFLLAAACSGAPNEKTVKLPMLVEYDPWTAQCVDNPALPGASGFGAGYASLSKTFTVGHQYRVSGKTGWSFLLTLDANGLPSVSEIQPGPHLTKAPVIRIGESDTMVKTPVEVLFGAIKEFTFEVPVDYLAWEIPDAYEMRVGNRQVELPDGKWELRGMAGWTIPFEVSSGAIKPAPGMIGMPSVKASPTGLALLPITNPNRVPVNVPALLGTYSILTTDGKLLLPEVSGPQTVALSPGQYQLKGADWKADMTVALGVAEVLLPPAHYGGVICYPNITNGTLEMRALRPGQARVNTPWGSQAVTVPDPETAASNVGLGWSPNKLAGLAVTARLEGPSWFVKPRFLRGSGADWRFTVSLAPLDLSSPFPILQLGDLPTSGKSLPIPAGLPSGAYALTVEAQPVNVDRANPSTYPRATVLVTVLDTPAASLWFAANRTGYRMDEPVEIVTWQSPADKPGQYRTLSLIAVGPNGKTVTLGTCRAETGLYTLAAGALAPGHYQAQLRNGNAIVARRDFDIFVDAPASHFPIHAYESVLRRGFGDVEKLNSLGVNTFLEQSGTLLAGEKRATGLGDGIAALGQYLPEVGPASRYTPQGERFLDKLDALGWRFFAQWGSAHQPYGYGITFTDPTVVNRLTMTSLWTSQYGRQHPSFLGMNIFDEGGTPRGPRFSMDASYLEYDAFAKKFGRAKPDYYGEDPEAARAWIYDKQAQHDVVYSGVGRRLAEVNALADPGAHLYLGTQNGNLNSMAVDGGHPPLAYKAITLSTFHWYPGYINTAFILLGNEYHFMQPKPIEFWPLIWADGHFQLTRHETNLAISRQVDGVGYFHWPAMVDSAYFTGKAVGDEEVQARGNGYKAMHARFTRFGDLFRAVRRDRPNEVAVLHSLYNFAPQLLPKKDDAWFAYNSAYRNAYTGYLIISGCLRRGMQAGWVSEEEIIDRKGLAGRKILIVPGITAMKPEVLAAIRDFQAKGGTVFIDAATTVEIPGARKLEADYGALVDAAVFPQQGADGKTNNLKIDRVVLPQLFASLQPVEEVYGQHVLPASPELLVTRQVCGKGEYYYCLNDRILPLEQLPAPLSEYQVQKYFLPLETHVAIPAKGVVYDVFAGKEIARPTGAVTVPVLLAEGEMALYAVLPEAVGKVAVTAPATVNAGQAVAYTVTVSGVSGKPLPAAVPLEIQVRDAAGNTLRPTCYRSTGADGTFSDRLRLGDFDPNAVTLMVTELCTGKSARLAITVRPVAGQTLTALRNEPVVVENGKALARFLTVSRKEAPKKLYIAIGDGPGAPSEADVAPLVKALRAKRIEVDVRRASELSRKGFDSYVGRGVARLKADVLSGQPTIEVDRPVIAVGASANNRLIRYAIQEHNWTRYADRGFPGPGRAYLVHLWQPFNLRHDALLAVAEDPEGIKTAVAWLCEQVK